MKGGNACGKENTDNERSFDRFYGSFEYRKTAVFAVYMTSMTKKDYQEFKQLAKITLLMLAPLLSVPFLTA
ncbi:MAG TPA: hypothetical protein GX745_08730 [Clostridiales bacterium]|nr:hypothetical protein [Clostridiales bacterium]